MPDISANHTKLADLKRELVIANHVLAKKGVVDAFGHVSVRHPDRDDQFLISRSCAPELVQEEDIIVMSLDAAVVDGQGSPYLESFIHAELYRARSDVRAVVHSHSPSVIPFTVSETSLQPIYHMAGFLSKGAPVFDIRQCFGCTDMLVRNREQGAALAQTLGDASVALMRGHGFAVTGASIPIAVYRAIYTELNAALQQKAIALGGPVVYLDPAEGLMADNTNMGVIKKPWDLWKRYAERDQG